MMKLEFLFVLAAEIFRGMQRNAVKSREMQ